MNEQSLFNFNIYITGSFKTEEQSIRIKEVGDFISSLFDKLNGTQLSGCISVSTPDSALEFLKRIEESDMMVVVSDEIDADSVFQLGYACKLGIPIVLFTTKESTIIGPFVANSVSCFVNTSKELNVLDIFISQAHTAKFETFNEYMHVSKLQADLNNEVSEHKEEEENVNKGFEDKIKLFKMKHEGIEKESENMYAKQNFRIEELSKYRTQTKFIGTIE